MEKASAVSILASFYQFKNSSSADIRLFSRMPLLWSLKKFFDSYLYIIHIVAKRHTVVLFDSQQITFQQITLQQTKWERKCATPFSIWP